MVLPKFYMTVLFLVLGFSITEARKVVIHRANRTTAATTIVAPLPIEGVTPTSTQNFATTTPIQVCGSNWTYFDYAAQCYILIVAKEDFNWHEAEEYCVELGGHLASIHDEVENVFLGEWTRTGLIYREKDCNHALSLAIQHYPFTGLLYFNDTEIKNFRWSDHSPTDYYSKKIVANDDKELASCLTIAGDNKYWDDVQIVTLEKLPHYAWVFVRCVESKRKRFVCQKPVSDEVKNCEKTETTACGRLLVCPSLWTYFEESGACYQKGYESDYENAERVCEEHGGKLAVAQSDTEYEFLIEFSKIGTSLEGYPDDFVWIGGIHYEDMSRTVIGRINDPTMLYTGELPASGCLALNPDGNRTMKGDETWKWKECSEYMRGFICKKAAAV